MSQQLLYYIKAVEDIHTDEDTPNGAWWAILENAVTHFNEDNGTAYDENLSVQAYLKWKADGEPLGQEAND